ncbi:MAG: efflux RND transporter permease subunit [Flammeovirgaceae bacterium]
MRKAIEFFVKYPIWANTLTAAALIFGLLAAFVNIKKSFFPEIDPGIINIQVAMPGASPDEMEEGITLKIEDALKGIEGIDEVTSTSAENFANITVLAEKNTDFDKLLTDVKNAVDGINSFPANAERPVVFKSKSVSQVMFFALTGDVDLKTLKEYAENIEDELLNSGIVSQIAITGYPNLEISIEVPEEKLLRYGMTFSQVAAAVRNNNRDISAGSIKGKEEEILIRSRAKTKDVAVLGEIILRANPDGSKVYLRDIANIKMQFADVPNKLYLNGKRAVQFAISKLPEEDVEVISKYCRQYIEKFNASHDNVQLSITYDFLDLLMQRLNTLISNGVVGSILVFVCLGLFLSLGVSFWVAAGIPVAFAGMFFIAQFFGITINMISLFGMVLVVGILVDDGIVISENVFTHFEKGKSPMQAAIDGTIEVAPSVFTSVTTTMVVFLPLLQLESFEFMREMAIVVITCLGFSMIEVFFALPAHLASGGILQRHNKDNKIRRMLNKGIDYIRFNLYGRALTHVLKFRHLYVTTVIVFPLIVMGLVSGGFIVTTFFPTIPFDRFSVDIALKAGTPEEKIEPYLKMVSEKAWELNEELKKEYKDSVNFIGYLITSIGNTSDGLESGSHAGTISVFLQDMERRKNISSIDISNRLKAKIGSIPEAEKFYVSGVNRFGKPISISLLSKDIAQLEEAKKFLKSELEKIEGLRDVTDNVKLGRRELQIELMPKAYFLGMNHADITTQIRQGFFGEEIQRLQQGSDEIRVWVRYPEEDRLSMGQLEKMKIKTPDRKEYPLTEVARYDIGRGLEEIKHYNGAREVKVEAELKDPNASATDFMGKIEKEIIPLLKAKFPTINIEYGGQQKRTQESLASFKKTLPPLLFAIIFLIALTFRSFSQTFLIMTLIPLGVFCAFLGHGIEGKPVSILSVWGILALSGVIINDAVVLLDKFNQNLKEGMSFYDAVHDAGTSRFRAINLTSITTVAGLYPLILEKSFQAQFLIPMAISVAYGVFLGTFITLFIFPTMIYLVNDVRRFNKLVKLSIAGFWSGDYSAVKMPSREEVEPAIREQRRLEKEKFA